MISKAIKNLSKQDKVLAKVISSTTRCELRANKPVDDRLKTPFEALGRSIIYQQLHGKAAAAILARLIDLYGGKRLGTPEQLLKTSEAKLRSVGLSGSKVLALKSLAAHASAGEIPSWKQLEKLTNDEVIERLTVVRGIGPWTVQMMLIFQMGRLDVLPTTDFGVQNGFRLAYKKKRMPTPKELEAFGERWQPYRSIAAWYLWRAVDLESEKKKAKQRGSKSAKGTKKVA